MKTNDYINVGEEIGDFDESFKGTLWEIFDDYDLNNKLGEVFTPDEIVFMPNSEIANVIDNKTVYIRAKHISENSESKYSEVIEYIPTIEKEYVQYYNYKIKYKSDITRLFHYNVTVPGVSKYSVSGMIIFNALATLSSKCYGPIDGRFCSKQTTYDISIPVLFPNNSEIEVEVVNDITINVKYNNSLLFTFSGYRIINTYPDLEINIIDDPRYIQHRSFSGYRQILNMHKIKGLD